MDRLSLYAEERTIVGKKVKRLRKDGLLPGHVFGKDVDGELVAVLAHDFIKTYAQAGETGLIDLKIGKEKVRPVLVRDVQHDPITGAPIHIDFYQVNLQEKVKVSVPLVLVGEEPEAVHLGEAIVLQTLNEVEVEALPADLVEKIEVDITSLKNIDDAITIDQLQYDDRNKLALHADPEEIVVKLAPAVSKETEQLLEEEAAEKAATAAEAAPEEGVPPAEGEVAPTEEAEGVPPKAEGDTQEKPAEGKQAPQESKPQ